MTLNTYIATWGWFTFVTIICAVLNSIAVTKRINKLIFIFKPLTLLFLLLTAWLMDKGQHSPYLRFWFLPALFFSLCGDIFLLFSSHKFFLLGLFAFLIAHLCYIVGLNQGSLPVGALGVLLGVVILYILVYPKIDRGLRQKGENALRIPTAFYAAILSLMLGSAWVVLVRPDWSPLARSTVILGSSLFYLSDLMLAWNRFVQHSHKRDLYVMMTYHAAQILLTASIAFGP